MASYKSFAIDIELAKKNKISKLQTGQISKPSLKLLQISIGNKEKLAQIRYNNKIFTVTENMPLDKNYKVADIFSDHIIVSSKIEPQTKFFHFLRD